MGCCGSISRISRPHRGNHPGRIAERVRHDVHFRLREHGEGDKQLGPGLRLKPVVKNVSDDADDLQISHHRDRQDLPYRLHFAKVQPGHCFVDDRSTPAIFQAVELVEDPSLDEGNPHRLGNNRA